MGKKVAFQTFGCKLNFSETSSISKSFINVGYQSVDFKEKADVYVINSCTVTGNAEKKCRAAIRQAHKRNPEAKIAIIGCFSQLSSEELSVFEGVDLVLGNKEKFNLIDYVNQLEQSNLGEVKVAVADLRKDFEFFPSYSSGDRTRSFLKVQDGCDNFCTFCAIPFARGRSRSDNVENTLKIAKEIALSEIKEVILTGVNVGDFGKKHNETFFDLITALDKVDGIDRIRISSIEPELLTNEVIDFVHTSNKFLPHFHIPLQSGTNKLLKAMKRNYGRELFSERINRIREVMPHCLIAADVIVGFPGESDADFEESLNFIKNSGTTYIHVFSYSVRPGTYAAKLPDKISKKTIKDRSRKLQILSDELKNKFYLDNQRKTYNVLFESDNNVGMMHGFTENYIKVKIKYNPDLINQIIPVKLLNLDDDGCFNIEID